MILKTIAAAIIIWGGTYLYKGLVSKSTWWNAGIALLMAMVNAIVFAILLFLATPLIWVSFGIAGLALNFLLLILIDKLIPGIEMKNYTGAFTFAFFVSVISAIIFWLL
jgi:putative membrane protein